jgi:hypothetical protein
MIKQKQEKKKDLDNYKRKKE